MKQLETKDIIKELRKKHGYTVEQVSAGADISKSVYPKYESGILNAGVPVLCKLADFYGVTTDYLLGREPIQNPLSELNVRVDDNKFIELYSSLPDYAKQIFVDTMSKLAQAMEQENPQLKKQRHVERLGDIEDTRQQDEQAKSGEETSCA